MPRTPTTTEIPLPKPVEEALMALSVEDPEGITTSVGAVLHRIREEVATVEKVLRSNHLVEVATRDLMRSNRRRGDAEIHVNARGELVMRVGKPVAGSVQGLAHTTAPGGAGLPSLQDLRRKAETLGVDVSHLGRRKRAIMEALHEASGSTSPHEAEEVNPDSSSSRRMRDEVGTSPPLPTAKLPRRR